MAKWSLVFEGAAGGVKSCDAGRLFMEQQQMGTARKQLPRAFASLVIPNYRRFFVGALLSNIGTWMESVAQGWLVLTVLTDGSAVAMGWVTALRFAAVPLLSPLAGAVADRVPKRKILLVTQTLLACNSTVLCILVATGVVELWMVFITASIEGCITAFDNPSRQAFVSEMVPEGRLQNAVGLNATSFNSARLVGPGVAGLLLQWLGVAPVLGLNAFSYLAMIVSLKGMKTDELHPSPARQMKGSMREGFAYIRSRPDIMLIMLLVFTMATFGMNFNITNATMAIRVFGKDAAEYGLLGSMIAIGTLSGALSAAAAERPRLRVILLGTLGFAFFAGVASLAESYLVYALLLIPTGYAMLRVVNTANATVQTSTPAGLRGRVMAVYIAIFLGGTPIGSPTIGWIQDNWGTRWGVGFGAIVAGVVAVLLIIYTMRSKHLKAHVQLWPPRVDVETIVNATSTVDIAKQ
ncbi:MAG: MFS transporter [Propionibacteriaceae bacterium]|jgi:MFS family permease|nr:MFS transporter [Propionibacteriaceae bacterium]